MNGCWLNTKGGGGQAGREGRPRRTTTVESGVERGRHGRGLRLTFPYRGLQTRTARRTAQGGADCRGGEDGAGRRGLQRWGSRAAADRNGTTRRRAEGGAAEARRAQGGAVDEQGGAADEQEAQRRLDWQRRRLSIGKVAAVAVAPTRQPSRSPTRR